MGHPLSTSKLFTVDSVLYGLTEFETKYLRFNPYFRYEVEIKKDGTEKKTFKFKSPVNETNPKDGCFRSINKMAKTALV